MHYIIISNSQAHEEKKKKGRQEKERRKETNKMMEPGGIKSKDFKNKEFVWYTIYHSLSIQKNVNTGSLWYPMFLETWSCNS